ncbi:leucine-rich repeat-containing G-protein coupled receptor 5-like [Diorhabda carinulata]|uniref:leucine-rich repeat-containing G-protein coupled receptor 5-like n=1 Tax=Diorhabda carinulata TaxID=1163345 RepID=UPI0025A0A1F5|nr:leucine-rich repeat-containing G-protein coupled receptor 5-like [Diorhabda carinulata]
MKHSLTRMFKLLILWFTYVYLINAEDRTGCRVDVNAENHTDIYCFNIALDKNEIPLDKTVPPSEFLTLHLFRSSGSIDENSLANLRDLTTLSIDGSHLDKFILPELPRLTYVEIQSSTIPHLKGAFKNVNNLTSLSLGENTIDIDEDDLEGLNNLERLKIYKENLTLGILKHLKNLKGLRITHCNIEEIPSAAFENNPNLVTVHIGDTPVEKIGEGAFDPLKKLETLWLTTTKLKSFDSDLTKELKNLKDLGIPARALTNLNTKKLIDNSPNFSKFDFLFYDTQCPELHKLEGDLSKIKKGVSIGFLSDWRHPQKTCT